MGRFVGRIARGVVGVWLVGSLVGIGVPAAAKDPYEGQGIVPTGITSFDPVFTRVGEIDGQIGKSEAQLRSAKANLNTALGLKQGTPITDGINELKARAGTKLGVAVNNQAVPKLTVNDAVPTNIQSAVDAVNGMTVNFSTSLVELQGLVPEITKLLGDTKSMPSRLKDEFASQGSTGLIDKLVALPKTTKALNHDLAVTKGLSTRTTSLTTRMTDILSLVQTSFAPSGGGGRGGKGGRTRANPG